MATQDIGLNKVFPIYNEDGTSFYGLKLRNSAVDSVVMSLGDKITGFVYYPNNAMPLTMHEYIEYNDVHYMLLDPPTIVREGIASENSELKGMTKYSFTFYHPMVLLSNFPFADVAVTYDEQRYLSEAKKFSWIGTPTSFVAKLNKNLQGTEWIVIISDSFPQDKLNELSEVLQFDNATIADALKRGYEVWDAPYVIDQIKDGETYYSQGKRFKVVFGLPSNEIYASERDRQLGVPYVFKMGQGVGLKNNSRTPRNNKIITRIAGYGSTTNIPYGYPQIVWNGAEDDPRLQYPLYDGIVGGQSVKLIKHPFTRTNLMPSVYVDAVNKKVNPNATGYNPNQTLVDYYDAVYSQEYPYVNTIVLSAPSYEIHEFDVKPELGDENIVAAIPLNNDLTPASGWDDTMDDDGNYIQSYFRITLPQLSFDLYACASITEEMEINMRGGACIGCTFPVQIDWDDYKQNFYDDQGNFAPNGAQRDLTKYPKSNLGQINVVCKKENTTFGVLMPNMYQYPQAGDAFVILGISMPLSYITNAEQRLDDEMKSYMLENNVHYYDYPLKFDEYFLRTHTEILSQIRPNTIIRFQFANEDPQPLFVKQLTIKYGDNPLPQYEITLTDNVEIVLNQLGRVVDDIEKLSTLLSILRQNYNRNVWLEINKKLSKVSDDTASGIITFLQDIIVEGDVKANTIASRAQGTPVEVLEQLKVNGDLDVTNLSNLKGNVQVSLPTDRSGLKTLKVGEVSDNFETGHGSVIRSDGSAAFDRLDVRAAMRVQELVINELQINSGDQIYSEGDTIETVEQDPLASNKYICTLKNQHDNYITGQRKFNVCRGIINTLAKCAYDGMTPAESQQVVSQIGEYYTCWFIINEVTKQANANEIEVQIYSDAQVPGGRNFAPCPLMVFQRWGNLTDTDYQSVTYLDSHTGRIYTLNHVTSPLVSLANYGYFLGVPTQEILQQYGSLIDDPKENVLYVDHLLAKNFNQINKLGVPVATVVEYEEWVNGQTYYFESMNPTTGIVENSHVWHDGCKWKCLVTGTSDEPTYTSSDWVILEGYNDFNVDFEEVEQLYDFANFSATLTLVAKLGYRVVTSDILDRDIEWTRISKDAQGNVRTSSDTIWNNAHAYSAWSQDRGQLVLTFADLDASSERPSYIAFKCEATLRDGSAQLSDSVTFETTN